jgi:hypothetical protein
VVAHSAFEVGPESPEDYWASIVDQLPEILRVAMKGFE